jgi:uncharacterized membrane protein YcaP (DUF421 family)
MGMEWEEKREGEFMFLSIAIKLVLGLVSMLAIMRVLGKKEMAQATPFDFIYALVLGGILEEGLYDQKVSVWHILFTFLIWGVLIYAVEILVQRQDKLRGPIKGQPAFLIEDGDIDIQAMERNHMELEQLLSMLRGKGVFSLREVKYAILETGGTLSVLKNSESEPPTAGMLDLKPPSNEMSILLIDEGAIEERNLADAGKCREWLFSEIKKQGYEKTEDIYFAEWNKEDGFYIKGYDKDRKKTK